MMDLANQLPDGLIGHASQQVENRKLNRGQRCADGYPVVSEIKPVDKHLLQEQVQVPRVLADEERLQVIQEYGVKRFQPAVPDRNAFGTIARAYSAEKIVFVT